MVVGIGLARRRTHLNRANRPLQSKCQNYWTPEDSLKLQIRRDWQHPWSVQNRGDIRTRAQVVKTEIKRLFI